MQVSVPDDMQVSIPDDTQVSVTDDQLPTVVAPDVAIEVVVHVYK